MKNPDMVIRSENDVFQWIELLEATSRRELSRMVKARNFRNETGCGMDCTGAVYAGACDLLRAYHVPGNEKPWLGVASCSEFRDV